MVTRRLDQVTHLAAPHRLAEQCGFVKELGNGTLDTTDLNLLGVATSFVRRPQQPRRFGLQRLKFSALRRTPSRVSSRVSSGRT